MAHSTLKPTQITPSAAGTHLPFLDGLRGVAALYVVCHHAWLEVIWKEQQRLPGWLFNATHCFAYGQHAVDVFIVLSGFCLMLPVVREKRLSGGVGGFIVRRARRILPAYYATIGLVFLLMAICPLLSQPGEDRWNIAFHFHGPPVVWSHLLLVHNINDRWSYGIDPPMWSVATEWQIYFFFALVLVPLYRRLGITAAACVGAASGLWLHQVINALDQACPWFLALFTLGMIAAHISAAEDAASEWLRTRIPWKRLSATLLITLAVFWFGLPSVTEPITVAADVFVGFVAAVLLIHGSLNSGNTVACRPLSNSAALWLGRSSYSLYLIHVPLLAMIHLTLRHLGFTTATRLPMMLLVGVPLTAVFAAGFSRLFETPFLRRRSTDFTKKSVIAQSSLAANRCAA